jgi:hypothetical protein
MAHDVKPSGGAGADATTPTASVPRAALIAAITSELAQAGFGLCQPFSLTPELRALFPFATLDVACPLGLLVANDRRLWPIFEAARERLDQANPLDGYVASSIERALGCAEAQHVRTATYFGWRTDYAGHRGEPTAMPLQRLASAIGFAALGPAHLSVHPEVGPWCAFRAVVVLGIETQGEPHAIARTEPCASCSQPCRLPFSAALAADPRLPDTWRAWLRVRDACPVGAAARYDEAQITYHYTRAWGSASLRPGK